MFLRVTTQGLKKLSEFVALRGELESDDDIEEYWPQKMQDRFLETIDFFDNLQETLALGLSADFHKDVDEARGEAGIEDARPAKVDVPTKRDSR